jgi:predicted CXXCH cytochrome family protein
MRRCVFHVVLPLLLVVAVLCGRAAFAQDQCFTCHEAMGDEHVALVKQGVHFTKRISCSDCHGGDATKEDMDKAMSPAAGFVGVPRGDEISRVCAKCHSDAGIMVRKYKSALPMYQMESLASSIHGELSTTGKERIAQCTSCHGAHGVARKSNPSSPVNPLHVPTTCARCHSNAIYMRTYAPAVPIDQLDKYRTSVHGRRNAKGDRKVAECASCHGSHEILAAKNVKSRVYPTNIPKTCASCHSNAEYMRGYGIPSDQFDKFSKSVHGVALLEKNDLGAPACNDCHGNHGAAPPGVESISKVCGTCHALNAELFSASPHKAAFDAQKLPECETCHGYHDVVSATDALLGTSKGAVCAWCHGRDPNSKGYKVAQLMRHLMDSLQQAEDGALLRVQEAEQKGMEIGEAKFKERDIRQARLEARTKVHSFDLEQFDPVVQRGLTVASEVSAEANGAVDEYYFRRAGLLVASLIITSLAVSLFVLIRRIERRQRARGEGSPDP